ncbi:MAG: SDR family oxidoreductase [Acidimicrobiaceae bacterium]|nr:SDR family oxidoreductase [Acidimicrobiaceae bacterium]
MAELTLENAAALVVGAGQGIGRSVALALASEGADVTLAARRAGPLERLAAEVAEASGRRTSAVVADIADPSQGRAAVDATIQEFGRIDVVVNIATYGGGSVSVADLDWDDYLTAVQINVIGTMEICRSAAAHMASLGGGSIINVSALSATTLMADLSRYTSTKGAMESMSKTMAKEVGPSGVRVNIVTPGLTTGEPLSSMFERMAEAQNRTPEEISDGFARQAALRRHVDPDDIAQAVLFLASSRSRNITGQEIQVTAGQHIM